ncbi:MAG: Flp pilus assembly complex ATPase component TadA [Planctomycetaceae bacterium]|jgi:Flp pilus assembly CpaF family ATPase|nr:Flp pilus assembly complex ATPase component TadA [Planctomycetaceae bacterium]
MQIRYSHITDRTQSVTEILGNIIRIGRNPKNDLILDNPFVAEFAAIVRRETNGWKVQALGLNGLSIGEVQVIGERTYLLEPNDVIRIFPFDIYLDIPKETEISQKEILFQKNQKMSEFLGKVHSLLLDELNKSGYSNLVGETAGHSETNIKFYSKVEQYIEDIANNICNLQDDSNIELSNHLAGHGLHEVLVAQLSDDKKERWEEHPWETQIKRHRTFEDELLACIRHFFVQMKLDECRNNEDKQEKADLLFWDVWDKFVQKMSKRRSFFNYIALCHLKRSLMNILFGYGPLEDLLRLPSVTEIMVINSDKIFVEKKGRIENSGHRFISDEVTVNIIHRIVASVHRHIDKSTPLADARLKDGSRVNAIIDPLALSGPCLTIRKFSRQRLLVEDLVQKGSLSRAAAEFLRASVLCRKNIIISGGTGSGKTTLLNCLSDFIPSNERIITIEDTAELQLNKEHVVRLETKDANTEGTGAYTIRDLVKNALRMRPDRIVVGECRGAEALDMLQAMNTGHDGSLTTIHANTAEDVILRLEVLVQMAADIPVASIHRQIVSAVDLIVQIKRMKNGRRCVSQISELIGYDPHSKTVEIRDLYLIVDETNDNAVLVPTGNLPSYMGILVERNYLQLNAFYL